MLLIKMMAGGDPFGSSIARKGGGGGSTTTTTVSGIDKEFKPYLKRVLSDVTDRYEAEVAGGPDAIVAKLDQAQIDAINAQEGIGRDALAGRGIYDVRGAQERDLQNLAGSQAMQQYMGGSLGGARAQRGMQSALADRSSQNLEEQRKIQQYGMSQLGEAGSTRQAYEQQRLDAPHTSASRYFGYLAGAPQSTTQTQTGGGGGK
jgi:hypothetical protein